MKLNLIITVFILNSFSSLAQSDCIPYFRQLSIAEYENFKGNTEAALARFEKSNSDFPNCTSAGSKFNFIKMYLAVSDTSTAYTLILDELKNGYKLETLQYIGIFDSYLGTYSALLEQKEDSLHNIFYSNLDHELLFFVRDTVAMDQEILDVINIDDSTKEYVRHQIFRQNVQKLADYTDENGIIGYKELGHLQSNVNLLLIHHRLDDENDRKNVARLIEKYTEAIKKGNATPYVIISLFDNMAEIIDSSKPQLFGSYYDLRTKEFRPFENIEDVDSLRISYGMTTLKEYAEIQGIQLPDGYKVKMK